MIDNNIAPSKAATLANLTSAAPDINEHNTCGRQLLFTAENTSLQQGGLRTHGQFKTSSPDKPLISIITVVYNNAEQIEKTINSVFQQTYDNVELIIIDGGSTDDTVARIQALDHSIDYWISTPDKGIYDAMNRGLSLAQGDIIGLINSADWCGPDALAQIAASYKPETDFYYTDVHVVFEAFDMIKTVKASFNYCKGMPICHQSLFITSRLYNRLGAYSMEYHFLSDYDFFMKMMKTSGLQHTYVPTAEVFFQEGWSNSTHQWRVAKESFQVALRYLTPLEMLRFTGHWLRDLSMGNLRTLLFRYLGADRTNQLRERYQQLRRALKS